MTIYSSINILAALKIPEIQKLFLQVMQDIVDKAILSEMVTAIETNDIEKLFQATGFTPAALSPLIDAMEQIYKDSAETTVAGWPARIRTPTGLVIFRFDARNPKVETDLREKSSALITRLTGEARENVRALLEKGMIAGANPRTTALDIIGRVDPITKRRIGGVIGLTENQANWVENVTRYLQTNDPRYFKFELRDKRFDSIVKKAMESGTPLSDDNVSRLTTAYKNRALKYRGETVARTETIQSLNRGEFMANRQAIDQGVFTSTQIKKYWSSGHDSHVRTSHKYLDNKYDLKNAISLDQPFVSTSGSKLMFPGDTSLGAGADEIANCRCMTKYAVNFFEGVD